MQREDGGWGEDEETYRDAPHGRYKESTPSQTAWALLGLMAAGEADHPAVARGIDYLTATQADDGGWRELPYNAVGFPRVFYLRYHGYRWYFPLLALARYRNLRRGNTRRVAFGLLIRVAASTAPPPCPFRKGRGSGSASAWSSGWRRRHGSRDAWDGGWRSAAEPRAGRKTAARRLIDDGSDALVSFGLAGGLDPALRPGALIVPRR